MGGGDAGNDGGDSSSEEATVNIRCSDGSKFVVQVNLDSTVEFFKSIIAQKCEIPPQQQRVIYKGRILKDDQTLQSYGLEADHTVHLVRGFGSAATMNCTARTNGVTSTNSVPVTNIGSNDGGPLGGSLFPGLGLNGLGSGGGGLFGPAEPEMEQMRQQLTQNPNMVGDILDMSLVQDLMNNPETIRNFIMDNPQMREIMDRNPELRHILNDPGTLRQTMEAARNPELMREMMRNTDRAMSNIESTPEGFNMLRRMYENVQEPFLNATTSAVDSRSDVVSNPFGALLGAHGGGPGRENLTSPTTAGPETMANVSAPNTIPLPNPWASSDTAGMQMNSSARSNPIADASLTSPGGLDGFGLQDSGHILGSMLDFSSFNQLMQNPTMSQMMHSLLSNPQDMNQILGLNVQLQNMLDSNPQLRDMMQNPEFVHQMTSPEMMQQLLTFSHALLSQFGRQQTPRESGQNALGTAGTQDNLGLNMMMNMFGGLGTGGGFTVPNRSQGPPEELYATQLSQLREMGFIDTQENTQALIATAGNVHAAVERLLGNSGH
ncbi:Ubiquitin domain-containing protein DSK2b [Sesamum alatum]|uniref:Ubiquitin domain-containing protein DSK2b n=1 Tax=Sesamum alatum TaxID=300844 RepID=A0AAE1YHU7_9LAMI|nr:Ubiquitin domain-containing protein DSK2b [Sesamum alatum]